MLGKVAAILLLLSVGCITVSASRRAFGQYYGVLGEFQRLTASSALMLPSMNVSSACLQQTHLVMQEAERLNLWALKILDATAKIPSGILSGNLNQLGDFDLCLEALGKTGKDQVRGRYCLADLNVVPKDERLKEIDDRMHAYRPLTSEVDDHGQRLPKLSSWRWGVCMPSACTAQDLKVHLREHLSQSLAHAAHVSVHVDPDACYTAQRTGLSFGHYLTISLFFFLITCVSWGTIQERFIKEPHKTKSGQFFKCFSLQKNWQKLSNTEPEGEDIEIVNGARALNSIALLLAHKQMAYLFSPFVNSTTMGQNLNALWTMIGRSSYIYTDSFIMLSGLLVAHSTVKELDKSGKINFGRNLISRYIRFTPNLLFLILANTYLIEFFGSGPLWGLVVDKYSNLCKSHMWRNLLYIHNYNGWENMCLTNTHQLAIDMQLYILSPILIYGLWKSPKLGILGAVLVSVISSWLRYTVALEKDLSFIIHYGVSIQMMFRTGSLSYSVSTHRATVYCIGLLTGFALRRGYMRMKISSVAATAGWSAAAAAAIAAVFGPSNMSKRGYVYDSYQAAIYNAFAPILWSFFLVWTGIACWNNKGGWVNTLLTWKYFRVFSRISYAFYLVQFPIFFYTVGTLRSSQSYHGLALLDVKEISTVFVTAILLTLAVDMPCQNLRRTFMPSPKIIKEKITKDKNANETQPKKLNGRG